MDMTASIAPKSDQLNGDDLMTGPVTATIKEVRSGSDQQPVNVVLEEFPGRPYRPSKTMRRVMVASWGKEASAYAGHQMTLFRNPETKFGDVVTGGIEISHVSHITKPVHIPLTVRRGQKKMFSIQPLTAPAPRNWLQEAAAMDGDTDKLRAHWKQAQTAGADQDTLNAISALATPSTPES